MRCQYQRIAQSEESTDDIAAIGEQVALIFLMF